ncbi:MAG: CHAT domain-containing protein [Candidatus Paceibacterota bacterium]
MQDQIFQRFQALRLLRKGVSELCQHHLNALNLFHAGDDLTKPFKANTKLSVFAHLMPDSTEKSELQNNGKISIACTVTCIKSILRCIGFPLEMNLDYTQILTRLDQCLKNKDLNTGELLSGNPFTVGLLLPILKSFPSLTTSNLIVSSCIEYARKSIKKGGARIATFPESGYHKACEPCPAALAFGGNRCELITRSPEYISESDLIPRKDMPARYAQVSELLGSLIFPDAEATQFFNRVHGLLELPNQLPVSFFVEEDWATLPVEVTQLPASRQPLCWEQPLCRLIVGSTPRCAWSAPKDRGLRVLLICANVSGCISCQLDGCQTNQPVVSSLTSLEAEIESLKDMFETYKRTYPAKVSCVHVVESDQCSKEVIVTTLQNHTWDIVHFAGHGQMCWREGIRCGCLLVKGNESRFPFGTSTVNVLPTETLVASLSAKSFNSLVFFSCCKSVDAGMAHLVAATKECEVVAFQGSVEDQAAAEFSRAFYKELLYSLEGNECDVRAIALKARLKMLSMGLECQILSRIVTVCMSDREIDATNVI